eukprot:5396153-Pleurochrysis_carterae.AAC.1
MEAALSCLWRARELMLSQAATLRLLSHAREGESDAAAARAEWLRAALQLLPSQHSEMAMEIEGNDEPSDAAMAQFEELITRVRA